MPTEPRPTRIRYAVLGVLCSLAFLTYLDRICIMRVKPDIAHDLHFDELTAADHERLRDGTADNYESLLTKDDKKKLQSLGRLQDGPARRASAVQRLQTQRVNEWMSWVFSAFVWGYVLFEVPGGWLADVWGPRGVIVRIVIWWSVFTALTGSVDTLVGWFVARPEPWLLMIVMVGVRFLFGVGEAGAYPTVARALARWFPYRDRAAAMGAIWMASRLGGAFSPLIIGALMIQVGGWRQAFWVLGAAGVVWSLAFAWWFRDRPEEKRGVNPAECALVRATDAGSGSIYADHEHRAVPWRRLFLSSNLWAIYLTAAAVSFSWFINVSFLPTYLKEKFEVDFADSEFMTGLPLLVSAFFCLIGGRLSDYLVRRTGSKRWGRSLPGFIGFALAGVCDLIVVQLDDAWSVITLICIACAVQDLAIPGIWAVAADVGGRYAGTVSGAMNAIGAIGGALSPLVAAQVSKAYDWDAAYVVFACSYFLGALLWLRIDASRSVFRA